MQERFKTFTVLVANINRCIHKIKAEEMSDFNLKSSHVSCLYYIYKENSLTAKELCDLCCEDKANISRAIKFLESNGYLVCTAKSNNRYQAPFQLTDKGKEVGEYIVRKIDNILNSASVGLSEEDRRTMYYGLNLINENLNKLCKDYDFENKVINEKGE